MAFVIQNTNSVNLADGIKCVVYGASGIGKTRLCATAPKPIIFSAEKGLLSLRKESVAFADISTYAQLIDAYKWAMTSIEAKKFDTFCLDSLSEIAEVVLAKEMEATPDPRKAYGNTQQAMYKIIRNFRDIPRKHVVMVAKQMFVQEGVEKIATPIMPSEKLQAQLPYFYDLVLHLFVGINPTTGVEYKALHTQAAVNWHGKDRSGNLAPIEYADLTQLFKKAAS